MAETLSCGFQGADQFPWIALGAFAFLGTVWCIFLIYKAYDRGYHDGFIMGSGQTKALWLENDRLWEALNLQTAEIARLRKGGAP